MTTPLCAQCHEKPATWRPGLLGVPALAYQQDRPHFCTKTCAATWAHERKVSEELTG